MKKEMKILGIFSILILVLVITQISALDNVKERRIEFGHVMIIEEIKMGPEFIAPGESGTINIRIRNNANEELTDVRVELNLPDEIKFLNSVSTKKIGKIYSNEVVDLTFEVISMPESDEGMYNATIVVDYLNHIGDERQDNDEFGILVIKSEPKIFIKIDSTEIYEGSDMGEVSLTFVNNNLANLKFLTVELLESENYKILSANKEYVGDLDSDDFESVDFRLSVENKKVIPLKLKLSYMDALNNKYEEEMEVELNIMSASELGIKKNGSSGILLFIVILGIAGYYFYKRYKKKKKKEAKYK
jgi:hypothetical protein